jgi:signal transduction histidine kinase
MSKPTQTESDAVAVPFTRVTGLVRQITHDVRNVLNNIDLQTAYLQGIITDSEVTPELKRLRAMVSESAKMLQALSARFWLAKPNFVTYEATIFFEDLQMRLAKLLPEQAVDIHWTVKLGKEAISADIEMLFRGLIEYFQNAFQFREGQNPIEARVGVEKGRLIIEIIESKSSVPSPPETWGCEPLVSTRRGGFGMGLFHARHVLAVHEGTAVATFDPAEKRLRTRVSLPLAAH